MKASKGEIRRFIWEKLEKEDIADFPRPCYGRIPNFKGSREASLWLLRLPEFREAKCVFCPPDYVLKSARDLVLREGKVLAAALPHMRGFVELVGQADTSIRGLARHGKPLKTPVDFVVQGSVAVDPFGNRLGKGTGYGDQEIAYLRKQGLLREGFKIATLVHDAQLVEDLSPFMEPHDIPVDYVLTPTRWFIATPGDGKVHEVTIPPLQGSYGGWEEEIAAGRKKVEVRLWRGRFRSILRGDRLRLGSVEAKVEVVVWYPSFKAMLAGEGVGAVIPGARNEEEALEVYRQIYSRAEEERYGVVAFRLSL